MSLPIFESRKREKRGSFEDSELLRKRGEKEKREEKKFSWHLLWRERKKERRDREGADSYSYLFHFFSKMMFLLCNFL